MQTSSAGIDFLSRSLRTTGIVLLFFLPFGIYYLGFYPSLAVFSGGVWGIVNLIFLSALVRSVIRVGGIEKTALIRAALIKFPLLYLSGYALLRVDVFNPIYLLIGFSGSLAVIGLKAAGRAILGLDEQSNDNRKAVEAGRC